MKKISTLTTALVALCAITYFVLKAKAQVGIGFGIASSYATSVTSCPVSTLTGSAYLCIVVPGGTTQPSLALSVAGFNSGLPFAISGLQGPQGPQGPTGPTGATGPQGPQGIAGPVQSFGTATCPAFSISGSGSTGSITIGPKCTETTP